MRKAIPLLTALLLATACGGRTEASGGMGEGMMADSAAMDHEATSPGAMGAEEQGDPGGMSMEDSSGTGEMMHDTSGTGSMGADTSGAGGMM